LQGSGVPYKDRDPLYVGELVREGIENDLPCIFTDTEYEPWQPQTIGCLTPSEALVTNLRVNFGRKREVSAENKERSVLLLPGECPVKGGTAIFASRERTMDRRQTLKVIGGAAAMAGAGFPGLAFAQAQKEMVTVVKIAGIPWFNAVEKGIQKGAKDFSINATMVGPANVDPAQQVKLLEDLIAKKVDVIGLVPLDVKVCEPVLKRAQAAGIKVITHEGPEQEGRDWNVELIDSVKFGEVQMERLAKELGGEGEYVVYVGTLTTPLHNKWADAAIAYQKKNFPKMKLAADRFPGADEIDTSQRTTLDVIKAYPDLRGILGFGSNGPIGAGNAVRQQRLAKKIAVVGTVLPSQAKSLVADGTIREGFLWNPTDAGYAMVAVAKLVLDGKPITDGVEIPGLGKAAVDVPGKQIKVDKIMQINKETIDGLIAQGL
jgi:simple sugar transport system substrate-binding protein